MKKKIRRYILFSMLFVFFLCALGTLFFLYKSFQTQAISELREEVIYLSAALNRDADAMDYLERVTKTDESTRISWISPHGEVLFDNYSDTSDLENHLDRPEIEEALQFGYGDSIRASTTLGMHTFYYAVRLEDGSILRLGRMQTDILGFTFRLLPSYFLLFGFVLLAALFLSNILANRIIAPIHAIDLEAPDELAIYEELSSLLSNLRQKNEALQSQFQLLHEKQSEFSLVIDRMQEALILLNAKNEIMAINKSALMLFEADISFVLHQPLLLLYRDFSWQTYIDTAKRNGPTTYETSLYGRTYELRLTPFMERIAHYKAPFCCCWISLKNTKQSRCAENLLPMYLMN
ncbi:MAG: hypothetical protein ACOX3W_01815 [Christensenellaceae bacterium]|jgi:two-component system phosphate regulon sensor histidine kinase PhoR